MRGHSENITKVHLLLTEPAQVSDVGPGEGEQQAPLHICGRCGDGSRVRASHPETGTHRGAKQHTARCARQSQCNIPGIKRKSLLYYE